MALKQEYKKMLVQSFKNVKTISNIDLFEEEQLHKLLDQLAETLFDHNFGDNKFPDYEVYQNYEIKKELEEERNKALALQFQVVGTFH